jgi:hypothetical protein
VDGAIVPNRRRTLTQGAKEAGPMLTKWTCDSIGCDGLNLPPLRSSPFSLLVCPHLWSIFFPSSLPLHVLLIICPMTRVFIRWIIRLSCPSIHRPNSPGQVELKLRIGTVEWIVGKTRQALHSSCYKAPHQHAPHPHNRKNNPPLTTDQVLILSNKKKRRIYISPFAGIHLRIIIGLWCVVERTREPQTLPSLPPPTRCGSI